MKDGRRPKIIDVRPEVEFEICSLPNSQSKIMQTNSGRRLLTQFVNFQISRIQAYCASPSCYRTPF